MKFLGRRRRSTPQSTLIPVTSVDFTAATRDLDPLPARILPVIDPSSWFVVLQVAPSRLDPPGVRHIERRVVRDLGRVGILAHVPVLRSWRTSTRGNVAVRFPYERPLFGGYVLAASQPEAAWQEARCHENIVGALPLKSETPVLLSGETVAAIVTREKSGFYDLAGEETPEELHRLGALMPAELRQVCQMTASPVA